MFILAEFIQLLRKFKPVHQMPINAEYENETCHGVLPSLASAS